MALPAEKGNQIWRVIDILNWGEDYFKIKGFESPKQEIEWLLCDLLNYKRIDLYVQFEQPIHRPQLKQLKEWIKRRIGREPLQYITGKTEFYGHKFNITVDVLIPRPETERVVDVALYSIGNIKTPKVLEVGSGSGCIAIAMGAERNDALIESVDVSESAITQAEKNADLNELSNIDFKVMDFLKEIPEGRFDLLVSNPPYIPEKEMSETMPEVHQYEPKIALTDERDGLTFYRRFAEVGKSLIKPGGWMVLEVGLGKHPSKAVDIFQTAGYTQLELIPDYNSDERVLKIQI
jgi:release factor glutamine methyltransferase|tara:strand:- start:137 stop:1012 length:876 start_codon:yes stop_codon:yes gene_type:complete